MKMSRSWTKKDTKRFISLVETVPELWNVPSADYKNRLKRKIALENLAEQFDTSATEIRRKLHNLRTQLNSELRKQRRKEDEYGPSDNCNSKWEFFEALKFMIPTIKVHETYESEEHPNDSLEVPVYAESASSSNSIPNKRIKVDEITDKPYELSPIKNKSDDDAQIFGDFVASSIRNLRTDNRRRLMKRKIQAIILEVEELDELDQVGHASSSMASVPRSFSRDSHQIDMKYESI